MLKAKNIFILMLFLVAPLSACSEEEVQTLEDLDEPITATTVDECIEDIQCAWDYFENIAFGIDYIPKDSNEKNISRITKFKIDTFIVTDHSGENEFYFDTYLPVIEKIFPKIRHLIKANIQVNNPTNPSPNLIVIFDKNDPDNGISEKNRKIVEGLAGNKKGWFERQLKDIRKYSDTDSFSLISVNKDNQIIEGSIIFVKKYDQNLDTKKALS